MQFSKNCNFFQILVQKSTAFQRLFATTHPLMISRQITVLKKFYVVFFKNYSQAVAAAALSEVVIQPWRTSQTCKRWTLLAIKNSSLDFDGGGDFHV